MHERPTTRGEPALYHQCVPGGEKDLGNRGGVAHLDPRRHRQGLPGVCDHLFGVASAGLDPHHGIADLPLGHTGADRSDRTRVLEPRDLDRESAGIGIATHPLERVGPIERGGNDVDDDLIGAGSAAIDLFDRQDLGSTLVTEYDGTHAAEPSRTVGFSCWPSRLLRRPQRHRRTRARGRTRARQPRLECRRGLDANPCPADAPCPIDGYQRFTSSFTDDTSIER